MNLALFYDTETTGLPLWHDPSDDPRQPHIVQLAAALVDLETRRTVESMDVIVRPDGWTIPDDVAALHGITTERALDVGVPEVLAVDMLLGLWAHRKRIAHNESFDARIVRCALKRYHDVRDHDPVMPPSDRWKIGKASCTATLATPICALPPTDKMRKAGRHHNKTPNLGEAYRHFTGRQLENAHTALADVQACIEVFFAIQDLETEVPF
jgi:DNA polymerase-3 subunit epsilon